MARHPKAERQLRSALEDWVRDANLHEPTDVEYGVCVQKIHDAMANTNPEVDTLDLILVALADLVQYDWQHNPDANVGWELAEWTNEIWEVAQAL